MSDQLTIRFLRQSWALRNAAHLSAKQRQWMRSDVRKGVRILRHNRALRQQAST